MPENPSTPEAPSKAKIVESPRQHELRHRLDAIKGDIHTRIEGLTPPIAPQQFTIIDPVQTDPKKWHPQEMSIGGKAAEGYIAKQYPDKGPVTVLLKSRAPTEDEFMSLMMEEDPQEKSAADETEANLKAMAGTDRDMKKLPEKKVEASAEPKEEASEIAGRIVRDYLRRPNRHT